MRTKLMSYSNEVLPGRSYGSIAAFQNSATFKKFKENKSNNSAQKVPYILSEAEKERLDALISKLKAKPAAKSRVYTEEHV